jgi:signal peptidase I
MDNKSHNDPANNNDNQESKSKLEPVGVFIWDLAKILLLSLIIIIPIRYFVFQPFVVQGGSMEPTFTNGDYLIIDELSYKFETPQRGQVLVLRYPKDPSQFFIKRLIGLPGEKVVIADGKVTIYKNATDPNAEVLHEEYLPQGLETFGQETVTLGEDQFFVLGDNRPASSDSRSWGVLPRKDIVGKVWLRVLPFSKFSAFGTPHYTE